jgi:hypothetical protein
MDDQVIRNPVTGVETRPIYNANGDIEKFVETQSGHHVQTAHDVAKHVEENAPNMIGNSQNHRQQIAEIPTAVVNDLIRRGIWGDTPKLLKWLQFEGQVFRATSGRLI